MTLPNSYTMKTGAVTAYFDAILNAEAPDRFSQKFLAGLGYSSTNDRLLIGILKELGFLNADGAPQERYYQFLDKSLSARVLAEGIREAYSDLFAVNKLAYELGATEAYDKLRSLYRGEKKDTVIKMISKTFVALCAYANFTVADKSDDESESQSDRTGDPDEGHVEQKKHDDVDGSEGDGRSKKERKSIDISALQYQINIVLPDTRDQGVYDAIFKSLRDHLG